jgi:hypothetical protein
MLVGPLKLTSEKWREYSFGGRNYRIERPKSLYFRQGGSTHRVVDSKGIVHCVPAPGMGDCVLRWENRNSSVPVNF